MLAARAQGARRGSRRFHPGGAPRPHLRIAALLRAYSRGLREGHRDARAEVRYVDRAASNPKPRPRCAHRSFSIGPRAASQHEYSTPGAVRVNPLESVLASVSFLERLRPDEIGRAARRFSTVELAAGEARGFAATREAARLVVVVHGRLDIEVLTAAGTHRSALVPGDYHGEIALLSEHFHETSITARTAATFATIDRDDRARTRSSPRRPPSRCRFAEAMARESRRAERRRAAAPRAPTPSTCRAPSSPTRSTSAAATSPGAARA